MDANILFGQALGFGSGWKVVKSEMDVDGLLLKRAMLSASRAGGLRS